MLKQLYELAQRLLTTTRDIRDNKAAIKKLEHQVEVLSASVRELAYEHRQTRENERHEREKAALRLENALLHFERKLLAAPPAESRDGSRET